MLDDRRKNKDEGNTRERRKISTRLSNVDEVADDLRVDQLDPDIRKQKDAEEDHTSLLGGEILDQEGPILGVGYFHGVLLTLKRAKSFTADPEHNFLGLLYPDSVLRME